ncbi:MAG: putative metal-binding motif-containing protein [Saprospiraceae bacterium]|nr:putative metal-binding motif-containing protein [Saprospiraceae bacterium]
MRGVVDEGVQNTYYADADNDSCGDATVTTMACSPPSGYVADNTDCNDNNVLINPGATEIMNGVDDNCDGIIDEGCSEPPCNINFSPSGTLIVALIQMPKTIRCFFRLWISKYDLDLYTIR